MSDTNGRSRTPIEIIDIGPPLQVDQSWPRRPRRSLWLPLTLFLLTVASTLGVGAEFARSYAMNQEPFSGNQDLVEQMLLPFQHPKLLLLGLPFSFTLLLILFVHEMGHYVACRIYGIDATYPYFIPAPTLIGTFGAFIWIRSPITTRRALFDVGISGPVAGFLVALPAMVFAIATSKIIPGVQDSAAIIFGQPPLMHLLMALFHPGIDPSWLLLNPVGRAAWVGLFATALNLLPAWQLDGGHIVYSLTSARHARISLGVALALIGLGIYAWRGWATWGILLLILSFRFHHPPLFDQWEPLDRQRRAWSLVALMIFLLCFTPWPVLGP